MFLKTDSEGMVIAVRDKRLGPVWRQSTGLLESKYWSSGVRVLDTGDIVLDSWSSEYWTLEQGNLHRNVSGSSRNVDRRKLITTSVSGDIPLLSLKFL